MKRLILIIMGVLLCTPLYSDMNTYVIGSGVEAGGCTEAISQTDTNSNIYFYAGTDTIVQSITGDGKILCEFRYSTPGSPGDLSGLVARIGNVSEDVSTSYLAESTNITCPAVDTSGEVIIDFEASAITLTLDATYYIVIRNPNASWNNRAYFYYQSSGSSYDEGGFSYGGDDWVGNAISASDLQFRVFTK